MRSFAHDVTNASQAIASTRALGRPWREVLTNLLMRTALALFALFPMTLNSPAKAASATQSSLAFSITFATARSATPLDGRLLLLLSTDLAAEPRFQIDDSPKTQIGREQ